ncbi:hypothetical protein FB451DRAFT_1172774 [Mycena latifolia]|nr:hypothetical protein FB451DRAFT_1172774 [Mycena latifolia]
MYHDTLSIFCGPRYLSRPLVKITPHPYIDRGRDSPSYPILRPTEFSTLPRTGAFFNWSLSSRPRTTPDSQASFALFTAMAVPPGVTGGKRDGTCHHGNLVALAPDSLRPGRAQVTHLTGYAVNRSISRMSFTRVGPGVISVQQSPKSCKVPPQPKQLSSEDNVCTNPWRGISKMALTGSLVVYESGWQERIQVCRTHGRKLWTVGIAWYTPRHKDCTSTYWYGAVIATRQTWPVSGQDYLREKLERGRGLSAVQCATRIQRGRSECHQVAVMTDFLDVRTAEIGPSDVLVFASL